MRTYVSLFSSAGVGCYGFKQAGFECIATNELIESRLAIQKYNHKCKYDTGYIAGDITKQETKQKLYDQITLWRRKEKIQDIDVVVATPPCQGMSTANYKKNNETARNSLVVEAIDIINSIKPKIFIFENVAAFMKTECVDKDGQTLLIKDCIHKWLNKDYYIYHKIVNFKDYGVPSSRPRTLVIGTRRDLKNVSPLNLFPIAKPLRTVRDAIGDLKSLDFGEIDKKDILHAFREYPKYMREWISSIKEGESAFDASNPHKPYKIVKGKKELLKGSYMGNKFKRMFWDLPAPCIATRNDQLASQSTIHPKDDRVLSIRELMRVMTIPDDFIWWEPNTKIVTKQSFLKKHELNIRRCIGEAVPTLIMATIANNINELLDFEDYVNCGKTSKASDNFYIKSYQIERTAGNAKQAGVFYTPQSVVFDILSNLTITNNTLKILEPSVGMGAFLPQLFRLIDMLDYVELDVIDIDKDVLSKLKKYLPLIGYTKNNLHINYINHDFLTYDINKTYDLIIGNPPYVVLSAKELKKYDGFVKDRTISNIFGLFLEKCASFSDEIAMVIPKTFLMTPEFNNLRKTYENFAIISIVDYGVNFFKNVFIEIISIHFKKKFTGKIYIENKRESDIRTVPQKYIFHKKHWIIYRDNWFDDYIKKLHLDIFDFYRDRQITNKYLADAGKIRVLRSKNILDDGTIQNIKNYDKYIDDVTSFAIRKYMNQHNIIMTNFTYNTRATILPDNTAVNGSLAILLVKNTRHKHDIDLSLYSTEEFRKYYAIVKNKSKFTINIDSNSIYYIGVK